jgi:hypothetical protein
MYKQPGRRVVVRLLVRKVCRSLRPIVLRVIMNKNRLSNGSFSALAKSTKMVSVSAALQVD